MSLHSHHHLAGSGDLDLSPGPLSLTALLTFGWNSSDSLLVLQPERALGIECGFCLVTIQDFSLDFSTVQDEVLPP